MEFTTSASALVVNNSEDLAQMRAEFEAAEARQTALNPYLRSIRNLSSQVFHELLDGSPAVVEPLFNEIFQRVDQALAVVGNDVVLREGWMADVVDQVVRARALHYFLMTGGLISQQDPTLVNRVRDDEYLGGIMGLSNELARYAVKRACQMDVAAIVRCRDLLQQFNGKLLDFEFRNGNLRRKYDGVKWGVRRMEDLLYELSLVGAIAPEQASPVPFDPTELENIRERMVKYDERRENIIKVCRDVQKNAKNAVYSAHKGDSDRAQKLLQASRSLFDTLQPDLTTYPNLRFGSAEAAMEEYVEARMFLVWRSEGRLPTKAELGSLTSTEYFGGLIDFTGEMGRYAVARATARDEVAVRTCLETDVFISGELVRTSLPSKIAKKMDGFRNNHRKLESIMYEMTLIKAGKGRISDSVVVSEPEPKTSGDGEDKD